MPGNTANDKGQTAELISEIFLNTAPKGRCFTFWYYLTGGDAGFIEISVRDTVTNNVFVLWKDGAVDLGNKWYFGQFGYYLDSPHRINIKAIRGGSTGSVALDDLMFREAKYCSVIPDEAVTGVSLPVQNATSALSTTRGSVTTRPPSAFDCDFEVDFCKWQNDYSLALNWTRNQGQTDSLDTGPIVDHTLGTKDGWYIYIETSYPAKKNDTARLSSPRIADLSTKCLTFYYHMKGRHIDTLNVLAINDSNYEYQLFSKSGNQGTKWKEAKFNLQMSEAYKLVFEARRGDDYEVKSRIKLIILFSSNDLCAKFKFKGRHRT